MTTIAQCTGARMKPIIVYVLISRPTLSDRLTFCCCAIFKAAQRTLAGIYVLLVFFLTFGLFSKTVEKRHA